jgi:hypothetical protein
MKVVCAASLLLAVLLLLSGSARAQRCDAFESLSGLNDFLNPLLESCGVNLESGTAEPADIHECCREVADFFADFAECESIAGSNSAITSLIESYSTLLRAVCNTDVNPDNWVQVCEGKRYGVLLLWVLCCCVCTSE